MNCRLARAAASFSWSFAIRGTIYIFCHRCALGLRLRVWNFKTAHPEASRNRTAACGESKPPVEKARPGTCVRLGRGTELEGTALLRLRNRQGDRINRSRVIAQLDVQHLPLGWRNGERVFNEAFRNGDRICEISVSAHRIQKEQLISAKRALLLWSGHAANRLQHRNPHQTHKRLPIPIDAVSCHRPNLQRSECGWAQQLHWIEYGEHRFRVLHCEIAVFDAEHYAE